MGRELVNAQDIAAILGAVAWPIVVMVTVLLLLPHIRSLLYQLANSLKIKVLKFKLFGAEAELTVEEAKGVLDEMLQEIVDAVNEVSAAEASLFDRIATSDEGRTVQDLLPNFERGNEEHKKLQKLRDRKLIRPAEGGKWQGYKHPIVTRFGRLVWSLNPKIRSQQDTRPVSHQPNGRSSVDSR
jgi:hypothetical protein